MSQVKWFNDYAVSSKQITVTFHADLFMGSSICQTVTLASSYLSAFYYLLGCTTKKENVIIVIPV